MDVGHRTVRLALARVTKVVSLTNLGSEVTSASDPWYEG